jgi:hypothetical protein
MDDSVFSLRTGALTGALATLTLSTASIAGAITNTWQVLQVFLF